MFRNQKLADCHEEIDFQTDFVMDLVKDCGKDFPWNLDVGDIFHAWEHHKDEDVLTYRDQSFPSKYTGKWWCRYQSNIVILLTVLTVLCQEPPHRST